MPDRFADIEIWATERGLLKPSDNDTHAQMMKLCEEVGELAAALVRDRKDEAYDAIGDIVVVLTILSAQLEQPIENCIEAAWDQIKDRKGKTVDGVFIKEES